MRQCDRYRSDIHCGSLLLGDTAQVVGGVIAEDIVVRGRVVGSIRGLRSRRSHISKATLSIKASPSSRVRLTSEQTQSISRFLGAKPPRSGAASAVSPTSFSPTPRRGQA